MTDEPLDATADRGPYGDGVVVLAGPRGFCAGVRRAVGLVGQVLDRLRDMGYGTVQMATVATEDVVFSLPPAVAEPRGGGT